MEQPDGYMLIDTYVDSSSSFCSGTFFNTKEEALKYIETSNIDLIEQPNINYSCNNGYYLIELYKGKSTCILETT